MQVVVISETWRESRVSWMRGPMAPGTKEDFFRTTSDRWGCQTRYRQPGQPAVFKDRVSRTGTGKRLSQANMRSGDNKECGVSTTVGVNCRRAPDATKESSADTPASMSFSSGRGSLWVVCHTWPMEGNHLTRVSWSVGRGTPTSQSPDAFIKLCCGEAENLHFEKLPR